MNRTTVFALVGAFCAAFLVAVLISASLSKKPGNGAPAASVQTVEILLASKDMPIGSTLAENTVTWQAWPKDKLFPNSIIKGKEGSDKIIGKKLRRSVLKDEPITPAALIGEAAGGYMAAALEPGMRAVSIKVDASSGVAGFITPGDYIDVILVYVIKVQGDNMEEQQKTVVKYTTETVLSNIRVLAMDQRSDSVDTGKATVSKTATLEVTAGQAEKLVTAGAMGRLQLALRKMGEKDKPKSEGTTDVSISKTLQKVVGENGSGDVKSGSVRVYSQSGMTDLKVRSQIEPDKKPDEKHTEPDEDVEDDLGERQL